MYNYVASSNRHLRESTEKGKSRTETSLPSTLLLDKFSIAKGRPELILQFKPMINPPED
jgi:hypothetical protein